MMTDKRLMVLRAMSMITHSTDMEDFMRQAELTMAEVLETLKELAQGGFVTKTKHGYAIVEKGKLALLALAPLPEDKAFQFYVGIDQPAGVSTRSIKEFYDAVETVAAISLEFHMERGDFENWVKTSIKDDVVANELAGLGKEGLRGEALRKQILLILLERFSDDVLSLEWTK